MVVFGRYVGLSSMIILFLGYMDSQFPPFPYPTLKWHGVNWFTLKCWKWAGLSSLASILTTVLHTGTWSELVWLVRNSNWKLKEKNFSNFEAITINHLAIPRSCLPMKGDKNQRRRFEKLVACHIIWVLNQRR